MTENFSITEFECKCGAPVPLSLMTNLGALAFSLQALRNEIKQPILINSGYRTPEYNKKIGGAPKSQHLKAKAVDIYCPSLTPVELALHISNMIANGKMLTGYIEIHKTFVHYDIRGVYSFKLNK